MLKRLRHMRSFSTLSYSNIPPQVEELLSRKLYKQENHPLAILTDKVVEFFAQPDRISDITVPNEKFDLFSEFDPFVTPKQCFEDILIPRDHIICSPKDTYYRSREVVLRPHTSAHQV